MNPMTDQYEFEDEWESDGYEDEWESEGDDDGGDGESHRDGPFDETTEMELAAELLGVADDEELEEFLGKLAGKAWRGLKKAARSPVGRALTGQLRGLARKALPIAGKAVGGYFGGPVGASIGGRLASGAGRYFGLELEGLSPEDQEFEVARSFVRMAGDAAREAANAPSSVPPAAAASSAIRAAARKHAPGLVVSAGSRPTTTSGRWVRRGRSIVLLNV